MSCMLLYQKDVHVQLTNDRQAHHLSQSNVLYTAPNFGTIFTCKHVQLRNKNCLHAHYMVVLTFPPGMHVLEFHFRIDCLQYTCH